MKLSANKKKIIVLCSMVVLLVVATGLNFFLNAKLPGKDGGEQVSSTYFSVFRLDRENTRNQQIAYYETIIKDEQYAQTARDEATSAKLEMCKAMEVELALEGLIKSKGYEDAVVIISNKKVNVIVKDTELSKEKITQIHGIIKNQTTFLPGDVTIAPAKVK